MKYIVFRPLRRIKKTGKITVASYAQWNKVRTADYAAFLLTIDNEYAAMPPDEHVYNHEGKPLFWRDFNPADIPVYTPAELRVFEISISDLHRRPAHYGMKWSDNTPTVNYCVKGLDCQGTPFFSHLTIDFVAEHLKEYAEYEPLTVGMVVKWLGWFLYQLQNTSLQIGK